MTGLILSSVVTGLYDFIRPAIAAAVVYSLSRGVLGRVADRWCAPKAGD